MGQVIQLQTVSGAWRQALIQLGADLALISSDAFAERRRRWAEDDGTVDPLDRSVLAQMERDWAQIQTPSRSDETTGIHVRHGAPPVRSKSSVG